LNLRQGLAPGAEEKEAQEAVAEDMSSLTDVNVPVLETSMVETEKKMQQRIENAAGGICGEIASGLDGDDDQPENRGDPCF